MDIFASDAAYRLTLSLVHSLWQGLVIGTAALLLARLMQRQSARARHNVYMAAITGVLICLPVNLLWVDGPDAERHITASTHDAAGEPVHKNTVDDPTTTPGRTSQADQPLQGADSTVQDAAPEPAAASSQDRAGESELAPAAIDAAATSLGEPGPRAKNQQDAESSSAPPVWQRLSPWVVVFYALGLMLAVVRVLLAYRGGQQIRRLATPASESAPELLARLRQIAEQMGLSRVPAFGVLCDDVPARYSGVGPVVIGIVKPIVILPAAALAQMTPTQIEAVIAHELAHIRRHDPLLMLFQRAAETVMFYHPMIWLLSRLASVEREHACDDLALHAGTEPGHYAEALLHVATRHTTRNAPPARYAAAALAMTQGQSKTLEHRLARLFGKRIPNPLRLTRKGLIGLALVGLVGLTALITTTRAMPPGPYFAEAEDIPQVAYPPGDEGKAPYPPIAMQLRYIKPDFSDSLYAPTGAKLEQAWDDASPDFQEIGEETAVRQLVIDLPDDAPHLEFPFWESTISVSGQRRLGIRKFVPELCYRADGSRYILARLQIDENWLEESKHFDLTLAHYAGTQRGPAKVAFLGPFKPDTAHRDTSGKHRVSFITGTLKASHNGKPTEFTRYTRSMKLNGVPEIQDLRLRYYDHFGNEMQLHGGGSDVGTRNPDGTYSYSKSVELDKDIAPRDIARIAILEAPRKITFRNVVLDWEGHEKPASPYAPYLHAIAQRLGMRLETEGDMQLIRQEPRSLENALKLIDVVKNFSARKAWNVIQTADERIKFADLDPAVQQKIIAAAKYWIEASDGQVQQAGLEMGLWAGDAYFVDPALAFANADRFRSGSVLWSLMQYYLQTDRIEQEQIDQFVRLIETTESDAVINLAFRLLPRLCMQKHPAPQRAMIIQALSRLAHSDKPWVWYNAISSLNGDGPRLMDARGDDARETVIRRLTAESDEMLRRCAVVVPDENILGRPVPTLDVLRIDEVLTPQMHRMLHLGQFYDIYDRWVRVDQPQAEHWRLAIGFLQALDRQWNIPRVQGRSINHSYIVERIVQHMNATFNQDIGGVGKTIEESQDRYGKYWRQIAREAVAWYRINQAEDPVVINNLGDEVRPEDVVGVWRFDKTPPNFEYEDQAGRLYHVSQTLELREDGSAVAQTLKHYADDTAAPISYERLEGKWELKDARTGDGPGPGLYITRNPVPEDGEDASVEAYYGSVWPVTTIDGSKAPLRLCRWGGSIIIMHDWRPITREQARELDPGHAGPIEMAEAFVASLMMNRKREAHPLAAAMQYAQFRSTPTLGEFQLSDDFKATYIRYWQEDSGKNAGEKNKNRIRSVIFSPIPYPATLSGDPEDTALVLEVEVEPVDGVYRVFKASLGRFDEHTQALFRQAAAGSDSDLDPYKGKPLASRVVGYMDDRLIHAFTAAMKGDANELNRLLDANPDWLTEVSDDRTNATLLHSALRDGVWGGEHFKPRAADTLSVATSLIDRGLDVNARVNFGNTALHNLCLRFGGYKEDEQPRVMKALHLLIERGADVNAQNNSGFTPLQLLAQSTYIQGVKRKSSVARAAKVLLEAGADPTLAVNPNYGTNLGFSPLYTAAVNMNPELMALLIEHGATTDNMADEQWPVLHRLVYERANKNPGEPDRKAAMDKDAVACAKLLIDAGADPWATLPSVRIRTFSQSHNMAGFDRTAYDVCIDSGLRDYLDQQMKPRREAIDGELRAAAKAFLTDAFTADDDALRRHMTPVWIYHDPLASKDGPRFFRDALNKHLALSEADLKELPIVGVTARLKEGAVVFRNKPGAQTRYTALVMLKVADQWRVLGTRRGDDQDGMDALRVIFANFRDAVDYALYIEASALPPPQSGRRSTGMRDAKTLTLRVGAGNTFTAEWRDDKGPIAETLLNASPNMGVIHIDHNRLTLWHSIGFASHDAEFSFGRAKLPDGARFTFHAEDDGTPVFTAHWEGEAPKPIIRGEYSYMMHLSE